MNSPTPEQISTEEALNNAFRRTSDLLASLQRLRLERGNMNRVDFRDEEKHLIDQIAASVEEYRKLADQLHSEVE